MSEENSGAVSHAGVASQLSVRREYTLSVGDTVMINGRKERVEAEFDDGYVTTAGHFLLKEGAKNNNE